jgi:tetratricopeptide (TPR) repeat protein
VAVVNPECELSERALVLVAQQVWHEYRAYTCEEGLDEAGFLEIYARGEADARRDVAYVRRALAEARRKGCVDRSLSFVVRVQSRRGSAVTSVTVRRALEGALPDGMKGRVVVDEGVETHPRGQVFGVSCMYRGGEVGADEFEYVKGVLELEPTQVFGGSVFGEDVMVSMFREDLLAGESQDQEAAGGEHRVIEEYRRVAVNVMRAAEMMGSAGQSSMAFAVVDGQGDGGSGLTRVLAETMPKGAAVVVCRDDGAPPAVSGGQASGKIVTVAIRVPTSRVPDAKKAIEDVVTRSSAMEVFRERRPVLLCTITMHDRWRSEAGSFVEDVASILPTGADVGLLSAGDASSDAKNTVRVLAALPKDSMQREVEIYKERLASAVDLNDWCRAAEDVRRVEVADGALALREDKQSVDLGRASSTSADRDAVMSPVVAGYERQSPSDSGSSLGLLEVREIGLVAGSKRDGAAIQSGADIKHTPDATRRVITVNTFIPGPNETPEPAPRIKTGGGGWKGFLKSLSPRKKSRAEHTRQKDLGGGGAPDVEDIACKESAAGKGNNVVHLPSTSIDDANNLRGESREEAVMNANIAQIVAQVEYAVSSLSAGVGSKGRPDVRAGNTGVKTSGAVTNLESARHAALLLPSWACSAACMRSAEVLIKAGLFEEARPFLVGATQATPEDPLVYFRLGYTYFGLNDFDSAARHFYEAIRRCTQHDGKLLVKIHINMGIALESMGNLKTAEREYSKAAVMDEEHPRVHKLLGSVRYALGNYEGAAEALERALKNVPDFADAWTDLGCVRRAVGNGKDAVRCFKMALASEPDNMEAHYNMGVLMRETSKPKDSLHHYDCVLDQDPEHSMALLGKAVALSMLADGAKPKDLASAHRKEAAACLRRFLDLCDPEDPLAIEVRKLYDMIRVDGSSRQISNQLSQLIDDAETAQRTPTTPVGGGTPPASPVKSFTPSKSQNSNGVDRRRGLARENSRDQEMDSKLGNVARERAERAVEKNAMRRSPSQTSHASQVSLASMSSRSQSQSLSRSISRTASAAVDRHPTDRSYDRLCRWHPPTRVVEEDFCEEVCKVIGAALARERAVEHTLGKLDVPLLQTLQPLTSLTFDALMTATYGARSSQSSPTKMRRKKCIREIHFHEFLEMILHLVRTRAPEHLVRATLMTLEHRVLPILDVRGTQHINFPVVMAMLAMLVDAPGRDRLVYAYRLLMARTTNSANGESLATKSDVVELMASLMAVFGLEHKRNVLQSAVSANVRNSAIIMTEKFTEDMEKYWPEYELLPLLANPLR